MKPHSARPKRLNGSWGGANSGAPTDFRARAWQGIVALLLWTCIAYVSRTPPLPAWVEPLAPLPPLVLVANGLGPRPWGARLLGVHGLRWPWAAAVIVPAAVMLVSALTLSQPQSDQPLTLTCASRSLLHGADPYRTYEPQCTEMLGYRGSSLTPIATGPFAHLTHAPTPLQERVTVLQDLRTGGHGGFPPYGYPPDATLLLLPVATAGWVTIWCYVMALCILLLAAILGRGPRPPGWLTLVAYQLLSLGIMASAFNLGWDPEYLSYLLLGLAFARISQPRLSSLALAAAVCTNQLPWVALPIYLAVTCREGSFRQRVAWLAGGVAVGVIPWWAWDHELPAELLHFLTLPYFRGFQSIGALSSSATPSVLYLLGFAGAIALCTLVAWRFPSWRWAMSGVVWGSFILSSRGLGYYYLPMFWLSPAILLGAWRLEQSRPQSKAAATPQHA
jgi:hypothetical protein